VKLVEVEVEVEVHDHVHVQVHDHVPPMTSSARRGYLRSP